MLLFVPPPYNLFSVVSVISGVILWRVKVEIALLRLNDHDPNCIGNTFFVILGLYRDCLPGNNLEQNLRGVNRILIF